MTAVGGGGAGAGGGGGGGERRAAELDDEVEVRAGGMGGCPPVRVGRGALRQHCLDAEDGRDGDLLVHHLRYDAGWLDPGELRAAPGQVTLRWDDPLGCLEGEARQSAFRFIAALVDR